MTQTLGKPAFSPVGRGARNGEKGGNDPEEIPPHRQSFCLLKSETKVALEMAEATDPDRGCSLRLDRGTKSYPTWWKGPRKEEVAEQGRQGSQGRQLEGHRESC